METNTTKYNCRPACRPDPIYLPLSLSLLSLSRPLSLSLSLYISLALSLSLSLSLTLARSRRKTRRTTNWKPKRISCFGNLSQGNIHEKTNAAQRNPWQHAIALSLSLSLSMAQTHQKMTKMRQPTQQHRPRSGITDRVSLDAGQPNNAAPGHDFPHSDFDTVTTAGHGAAPRKRILTPRHPLGVILRPRHRF